LAKANLELPKLTHEVALSEYNAPQQVASKANFVKRRRDFVISTSGGVQIVPWALTEQVEEIASVGEVRKGLPEPGAEWVWE
jgi:hypothetical protein